MCYVITADRRTDDFRLQENDYKTTTTAVRSLPAAASYRLFAASAAVLYATMGDEEAIVRCETTKGTVTMKFFREWSPNGYDRAIELYERHFFDGSHFFRAIPGFLVQFGISYSHDQELQKFAKTAIQDDPKHVPEIHFKPGIISYAGSGPNSRTSQMFISYGSAQSLGTQPWETPLGQVIEGMENAEQFYSYGDMPPWGKGPAQGKIHGHPEYIQNEFPLIDSFVHCKVERFNVSGGVGGNKDTATNKVLKKEDGVSDEETFQKQRQAVDVGANKNEGQEENVHEKVANLNLNPMHHTTGDKKMMGLKGGPEAMGMVETHESATIVVVLAGVVVVGAFALIVFLLRSGRKVSSKTS